MLLDPFSRRLLRGKEPSSLIVLMYHSIQPGRGDPDWRWAVSLSRFREQLDLLHAYGWQTACIRDLNLQGIPSSRTVVITFDDGYADNFAAFEELEKRGMRATWFIVSRDISKASSWTDPGSSSMPMLTAEQLRTMTASGMETGSHSRSHCRLVELKDSSLWDEVANSKAELEDILGSSVESFAFPYGMHDNRTVEATRLADYQKACITRSGWALMGKTLFRIRRISVFNNDNLTAFARKLTFADNDVSWSRLARYGFERLSARLSCAAAKSHGRA